MEDTLALYIMENPCTDRGEQVKDCVETLGGLNSQYYNAMYQIVMSFLCGESDKKRRTIILHGRPNSGKSKIASLLS
jgi:GTP1/Obg family GTP-binding protein